MPVRCVHDNDIQTHPSISLSLSLHRRYISLTPSTHPIKFQRKRFSQSSHEYLLSTLQHTGAESIAPGASAKTTNVRLNFNHPVKSLSWVVKGSKHGQFTTGNPGVDDDRYAVIQSAKLQLNGHDRFDERTGAYFNGVQPFEHVKTKPTAGVYMYSFALRPGTYSVSYTPLRGI
jgi:hypothetical protein